MKNKFVFKVAQLLTEWAIKGAKIKRHGRMCNQCAFRKGSVAQSEPHNVSAAANCLANYGQFNCHINDFENANKPCVGFLHAKEYRDKLEQQ